MKVGDYIFIVALVAVTCLCVYMLLPAYSDYNRARSEIRELEENNLRLELESRRLRDSIHDLQNDPKAIERIAREKLGWCREDEKIYHFHTMAPEDLDD